MPRIDWKIEVKYNIDNQVTFILDGKKIDPVSIFDYLEKRLLLVEIKTEHVKISNKKTVYGFEVDSLIEPSPSLYPVATYIYLVPNEDYIYSFPDLPETLLRYAK